MSNKAKVMVGMSGGVDSTVTALLLLEQGYDVTGVTMRLWSPDANCGFEAGSCCSVDDIQDARGVCHQLGIPHYVLNYKELFEQKVVENFAEEYDAGRTPNPCIACNRYLKFSALLEQANTLGFEYIATGHYSSILWDEEKQRWRLKRALSHSKDQSYVLYTLTQHQLAHTLMPLGGLTKDEVREIAKLHQLEVASKPDSQDICFVPDGDYNRFLEKYTSIKSSVGNFISPDGKVLGQHKGIRNYTIGQRKGLGIALGQPAYVSHIDATNNTITLSTNESLFQTTLTACDLNWIDFDHLQSPLSVQACIRYSHPPANATISPLSNDTVQVHFENPQRAITPGQAVVFYNQEYVIGGGTIIS